MIPITKPYLGDEEVAAAARAIQSGWVTQGPMVAEFEAMVATHCGTTHAVAVSNCTTALHLALLALDVGPGDEVICPSLSFIATANAIRYTGAIPVFADIDPETLNLDPTAAEAAITPRTKLLMPVHQFGLPADMSRFLEIAKRHGVKIIEDAACALGSQIGDTRIGGHSEMACFSFHPRKVITTGEGGMITTNCAEYAERLRLLRQHGMSVNDVSRHNSRQLTIERYECLGYNYRMTDIQAAIGMAQLTKLPYILERRRVLAQKYTDALQSMRGLVPLQRIASVRPNYQSYAVRLADPWIPLRNELVQFLRDQGIGAKPGIQPIHLEPATPAALRRHPLPQTEHAAASVFLLPLYPSLTDDEQSHIITALRAWHHANMGTNTAYAAAAISAGYSAAVPQPGTIHFNE